MSDSYVEREFKFDVAAGFAAPDWESVWPHGLRVERHTARLRSDYFDTAEHTLLDVGMTLRRRTGTTDEGWQLKVPHAPFRGRSACL